ncbi:cystatin-A-like [Cottoperca gobio]|uniref:Cystatin-B n=1 Tax=Cottoperca gobio TaxID=56716 RepID=A0A6J2RUU9_COTGO|nr:cystatin-A-like [Cottoperca gobio]XP_029313632.1 cystatin-A-like [Cottoperca gobio]XP_029313724.1 cystatin-A-like [Cottoperca gobio]
MACPPGDWSETKDATEETQDISNQVKCAVEVKTGKCYEEYKAVKYRNHVGGENFLIKVFVGVEDYIHLSVFKPLLCSGEKVELCGVEEQRTKELPLVPFPN